MALKGDKLRGIVGGITTSPNELTATKPIAPQAVAIKAQEGQGMKPDQPASDQQQGEQPNGEEKRRFAKRGRPKNSKDAPAVAKGQKVKVSLFLSEVLVNDLYDWAHADRIHPGEMFERALQPFHERELKRRNGGKA